MPVCPAYGWVHILNRTANIFSGNGFIRQLDTRRGLRYMKVLTEIRL